MCDFTEWRNSTTGKKGRACRRVNLFTRTKKNWRAGVVAPLVGYFSSMCDTHTEKWWQRPVIPGVEAGGSEIQGYIYLTA